MSDGPGPGAGGSLGRSTAIMAAGTATSRVFGLLRVVALAAVIGSVGASADAFQAAYWLPNVIYMLVAGGVLNAVLVPQILKAYRTAAGHAYVDRLLTVSAVVIAGVTVVATAASPLVVQLVVSRQTPEFKALTVAFALWSIPQVFFYGLYTLLGQVLNARGNFGPYMWAPVVNNVVAIAGIGLFGAVYGRVGELSKPEVFDFWTAGPVSLLAGTATLGVVAQALVLVWPLRASGFRWTPRRGWRGVGLSSAARVAGWTFAALVVGQVGVLAVVNVASAASDAAGQAVVAGNNHYSIAFTVFMLPHSLVTVSLVTAMYTRLSGRAAVQDTAGVRRDLATGLRLIGVFTCFATAALVVLALPVSRALLFADTEPAASTALAPVIVTMSLGLVALGAWSLVQRVYYAYEDARALFFVQVPMAAVVAAGSVLAWLVLPPRWWTAAAGAAIAASYVLGAVRGLLAVRTRLGGIGGDVVRLHVRAGVAAVVSGLLGWAVSRVFGELWDAPLVEVLVACAVVGGVMLAAYVALLRVMGVRELEELAGPLLRRAGLRRSMNPPGAGAGAPAAAAVPPVEDVAVPSSTAGTPSTPGEPAVTTPRTDDGPPGQHGGDHQVPAIGRGTQLAGRYRLDQPAGTDLPGVDCWQATDVILDRPVRACLLRSGRVQEAQDAARRAALVTDPRLLRVLDVGDHDDVAYVVTEPLRGRSLAELTARGPLPAAQARAVIGEAAVALEVARRRGVHHLALRPSSVRVTSDGGVLVTGLAMDGEVLGHVRGDARATTRADTVALVGLLYLTLTGRWPVPAGASAGDVAPAPVVQGSPVPPADLSTAVPNDLDTLCAVTLGPHDDGPHSPAELVHELEPWVDVDVAALEASPGWEPTGAAAAVHGSADVPDAPDAPAGADAGAGDDGPDAAAAEGDVTDAVPVARQSVRDSFAAQTPPAAPPGTPPPAILPAQRIPRPDVAPAGAVAAGALGAVAAAASAGPSVTETVDDGADAAGPGSTTRDEPDGADLRPDDRAGDAAADDRSGDTAGDPTDAPSDALVPGLRPAALASGAGAATGAGGAARPALPPTLAPAGPPARTPGARPAGGGAAPRTGAPAGARPGAPRPSAPRPSRPGSSQPTQRTDVDALLGRSQEVLSGRMRFDPTPWVLGAMALAVVVGLVIAWNGLTRSAPPIGGSDGFGDIAVDESEAPAEGDGTEGDAPAEDQAGEPGGEDPATASPVIASGQQLDPPPQGDDNEHPEAVDLAIDGDPTSYWYSRTYASPTYGMKPGIGYAVTLAEPATVTEVRLYVNGAGGNVEVRATDPSTPTQGEVLASGPLGPETVLTLSQPTETQSIVLWFTALPQTADGRNRIELTEVRVG